MYAKDLAPNVIVVLCERLPCTVVDPFPQNCLVKWPCPGCGPDGPCPPDYQLVFDDATLKTWQPQIVDGRGREVAQKRSRVGKTTVLSFRPSQALFHEGSIGDYVLLLRSGKGIRAGVEYRIQVRLKVAGRAALQPGSSVK